MAGGQKGWHAAADEIERLLGASRGTIPISRRIDHRTRAAEVVVRARVEPGALPDRLLGFKVVVEPPTTPLVTKGLL
ncbi:hypothetical protein [uncultured Enterovirga sp.]|uniref:hypothetical protein n=1 Tax=uncultured Enterovirga sp. TaxID=2026352 RepID=UPI0035CA0798